MTVAVALQINDGVVLASDSAITMEDASISPPNNIVNVYGNGNKIFNIVKGLQIGGVFYGTANFGPFSIPTLVKDVRRRLGGEENTHKHWKLGGKFTIEDVAKRIREYLYDEHFAKLTPVPTKNVFGFIVAGFGGGSNLSETWLVEIKNGKCDMPRVLFGQGISNVYVGGDPDAFDRLINGYSQNLLKTLLQSGIPAATVAQIKMIADQNVSLPLIEAAMPIQDAIGLAEFFVDTTSRLAQYKRGFATVGGRTESAAITRHEGFRWVKRKHYFSSELNPGA